MTDCKCFDNFEPRINDLAIGNPDDKQNRINALEKSNNSLQKTVQQFTTNSKPGSSFFVPSPTSNDYNSRNDI